MADETTKDRGDRLLERLFGPQEDPPEIYREITELEREYLFGKIWLRPDLALRDRSLITVAALTALGRAAELRIHLRGALKLGLTNKQLEEVMIHLAHYSGWPTAIQGLAALEEVLEAQSNKISDT